MARDEMINALPSCAGIKGTRQILLAFFSFSESHFLRSSISGIISLVCTFWEEGML